MDRRKQWSLLVVRGDGTRVVRLTFPRRLPMIVLVGVTMVAAALAALAGDWWQSRARVRQAGSLAREIDVHRALIAGFNRQMADMQQEVASWRDLHVRIWEPFGPHAAPRGRATGIGGASTADVKDPRASEAGATLGPAALEDVDRLAETVRQEGENLRALERLISRAGKALASLPSRWPIRGPVNSEFGSRQSPWSTRGEVHSGIDIGAERGTQVLAPAAGTVAFAGTHAEYGLAVMLDHGGDLRTIYGHLSKIGVATGQQIARGAELGLTGNSGRSSGPHLHYEILVKNRPVNPRAFFWE